MGRYRKKPEKTAPKLAKDEAKDEDLKDIPKSFVIKTGKVSPAAQRLALEVRQAMRPWVAGNLKERKQNVIKDFVSASAVFYVSHLQVFTQSPWDGQLRLHIAKLRKGPTYTFNVEKYALASDIRAAVSTATARPAAFLTPPLVVINNFQSEELRPLAELFHGLYPQVDVAKFSLKDCRRVVLFDYDKSTESIAWRQYAISSKNMDLSRGVRKLLKLRNSDRSLNFSNQRDVSEFVMSGGVTGAGNVSDSEADETAVVKVKALEESINKLGVTLREIGPRMTLKLEMVRDGVLTGRVAYKRHGELFVDDTIDELANLSEEEEEALDYASKKGKSDKREREDADEAKPEKPKKKRVKFADEVEEEPLEVAGASDDDHDTWGASEVLDLV